MPRFVFEIEPCAAAELQALLPTRPTLVFDPGNPDYEMALVVAIPRGYGAHDLRLSDQMELVYQDPPVATEEAHQTLRRHLLQLAQTAPELDPAGHSGRFLTVKIIPHSPLRTRV
jgi:hypothetical protein